VRQVSHCFLQVVVNPKSDSELAKSLSDDPNVLATKLIKIGKILRENLQRSQDDMKHFADAGRQPAPSYKPGDKVNVEQLNLFKFQYKNASGITPKDPSIIVKKSLLYKILSK
jgi:hypothetical protein